MSKDNTVNIDLVSKIEKERVTISAIGLFDALLIILFLVCLSSKFIVSSGATIALKGEHLDLPVSISSEAQGVLTSSELSVLHIQSKNMILFEGGIFNMDGFKNALKGRNDLSEQVLLLKADKNCDLQTFLNICELAQAAGFKAVQIASLRAN